MNRKITNSRARIREMMDSLELKQSDIVKRTGINKSALSNYLSGVREPRQDKISAIADPFGVSPAWLMGYDVPMFLSDGASAVFESCGESHRHSPAVLAYAERLAALPCEKQRLVEQIIDSYSEDSDAKR